MKALGCLFYKDHRDGSSNLSDTSTYEKLYIMKKIVNYVYKSLNAVDSGVDSNIENLIESTLSKIDCNSFKEIKLNDLSRFDISKENEKLFIDAFESTKLKALSTADYNDSINDVKFNDLKVLDKADFDAKNGDIIIVDEDKKDICHIDLKISENFLGAVSIGSLVKFNENGVYACINKSNNSYKLVSHKVLYELVKNDLSLITTCTTNHEGYEVIFEGKKYMSEDFIKGNDINRLVK